MYLIKILSRSNDVIFIYPINLEELLFYISIFMKYAKYFSIFYDSSYLCDSVDLNLIDY